MCGSGRALFGLALDAGAERGKPERALDFGGHGPGAVAFMERHFFEGGAAQAAAWSEKRDRLDQIGLAGAIRPVQARSRGRRFAALPRDNCGNWSASGGGSSRNRHSAVSNQYPRHEISLAAGNPNFRLLIASDYRYQTRIGIST